MEGIKYGFQKLTPINTADYIALLNEETFDFDEMLFVLDSDILNTHKLEMLKLNLAEHSISTINKKLDNDIKIKLFISTLSLLNEEQCKQSIPQINLESDYLGILDKNDLKLKLPILANKY